MPIAVVGIGFRGPGDAVNVHRLWDLIREKRETRTQIPKHRFNNDAFYHPDAGRNGTSNVAAGHFIQEDLAKFDASFFNMTSAEAAALDPQQRLLLECTYEAFENAGILLDEIAGGDTAVFMGNLFQDYADMLLRDPDSLPLYQSTSGGQSHAMISNRISYFYDLKGPSVTVDTACSSSLVALHLACQSLRAGEAKQAVVGGASVILSHEVLVGMSTLRFLSPDGRCYSFDSRANGYARGEGVGCLVVKPLADALRDGDTIRAVIRNTGTNQDGKTAGIALPSADAQERLFRRVYEQAQLDPLDTGYLETHGTGTPAGDPVEAGVIASVFCNSGISGRERQTPLPIGSIKTNIGHLEGASGVASMIKCIMMLEKRCILPSRNFETPNPRIPLGEWNLRVPVDVEPWSPLGSGSLRASINSFGYGGTNCHVIVESAADYLAQRQQPLARLPLGPLHSPSYHNTGDAREDIREVSSEDEEVLVMLQAHDQTAGKRLVQHLAEHLATDASPSIVDVAYTLNERRSNLPWKAFVIASSTAELTTKLAAGLTFARQAAKPPVIGFVFTGQGAQWHAMGRDLVDRYPIFRKSMRCATLLLKELGATWDAIEELSKPPETTRVNQGAFSQPLCTSIQLALVDLLRNWGITASAVVGHSSGEIAAAYAAGSLTFAHALAVAYFRGVAATTLQKSLDIGGAMLAAGISRSDALPILADLKQGCAVIACENSPSSITLSGDRPAIDELEEVLKVKGRFARRLLVDLAYHSHHMEHVSSDYLTALQHAGVQSRPPSVNFFSSVTGSRLDYEDGSALDSEYWVANMLSEVKFSPALQALCVEADPSRYAKSKRKVGIGRRGGVSVDVLLEIGPHAALAGPIKQILQTGGSEHLNIVYLPAMIRNKAATSTIFTLASSLITAGLRPKLSSINHQKNMEVGTPQARIVSSLPPYPWSREVSYWAEPRISKVFRHRAFPRTDLLGLLSAGCSRLEPTWRNFLRLTELPWLQDHKIQGQIVYPGAGYVVMAVEATAQMVSGLNSKDIPTVAAFTLREVVIRSALVVSEGHSGSNTSDGTETLVSLRRWNDSLRVLNETWYEFVVSSVDDDNRWTEHCRGLISTELERGRENYVSREDRSIVNISQRDCTVPIPTQGLYSRLAELGIEYGPTFANMTSAWTEIAMNDQSETRQHEKTKRHRHSVATVVIPDTAAVMPMGFQYSYILHPATLDSCLHAMFAAIPLDDPAVPVSIREMRIDGNLPREAGTKLQVFSRCHWKDARNVSADLVVDVHGESTVPRSPVIRITGLSLTTIARSTSGLNSSPSEVQRGRLTYTTYWMPDIAHLALEDFVSLCPPLRPHQSAPAALELLEQAAFYLMQQAHAQLLADRTFDETLLPSHMRKLLSLIRRQIAESNTEIPSEWHAASELKRREVVLAAGKVSDEGALVAHAGERLPDVLRGRIDALSVLVTDDRLTRYYANNIRYERSFEQVAAYLRLLAFQRPDLDILEVGAGTGGATKVLLQTLCGATEASNQNEAGSEYPQFNRYDFTDVSSGFFEGARERLAGFACGSRLQYKKLDIEKDAVEQGFEESGYDVVIAANVLHATSSVNTALHNVRRLLKPRGKLIMIELTKERLATSLIFGQLPGWWIAGRPEGPILTESEWDQCLRHNNFDNLKYSVHDCEASSEYCGSTMIAEASTDQFTPTSYPPIVMLPSPDIPDDAIAALKERLVVLGVPNVNISSWDLVDETDFTSKVCISIVGTADYILRDPTVSQFRTLQRILLSSQGLLWVTPTGLGKTFDPLQHLATGLLRTLRSERSSNSQIVLLHCNKKWDTIVSIFASNFKKSNSNDPRYMDVEYAVAENQQGNGVLNISRLLPAPRVDTTIKSVLLAAEDPNATITTVEPFHQPASMPLELGIETPGLIDTLHFVEDGRVIKGIAPPLAPDEIEMEVRASGINFRDVMMAMGQIELEPFGGECAGIVTAIGSNVTDISIGERVVAYKLGCFSTRIRQRCDAIQKLPKAISFSTAAALPVAYCTAWYALEKVARVQKGETVLIHAASGGLGQAAINVAHHLGAIVYATVSTPEKRTLLQTQLGVPSERIFDSRDANAFCEGVMWATGGQGVDVVLNSVAGEALRRTFGLVAPYGRFIELGKRDFVLNSRLEMENFRRNITLSTVDLAGLITERPALAALVWSEVMDLVRAGKLQPPSPITECGFGELESAMRSMQAGRHIGKLVVVPQALDRVKISRRCRRDGRLLRSDVSYLLVGGLGGVGRAIAEWMLSEGAKNFLFASRSGKVKSEAQETIALLERSGARVAVYEVDVASTEQVQHMLHLASKEMPPIKGVIQGAMVLNDDYLENLTHSSYLSTILPKVHGTHILHSELHSPPSDSLDFFILLSSLSGIFGNASQSAYAAASSYLDAFACYLRETLSIPATSIDLGIVRDVGYVAQNEQLAQAMERQGLNISMSIREVMAMIETAILGTRNPANTLPAQLVTGLGQWDPNASHASFATPFFSHYRQASSFDPSRQTGTGSSDRAQESTLQRPREKLSAARSLCDAREAVVVGLSSKVSTLLMLSDDHEVSGAHSMSEYGMDSLVAVEMRNWIFREFDVMMAVLELLENVKIEEMAARIVRESRVTSKTILVDDR